MVVDKLVGQQVLEDMVTGSFLNHVEDGEGDTVVVVVGMKTGMNADLMTAGTGEETGVEALVKNEAGVLLAKALQRDGQELNSGIVKGRSVKQLKLVLQGLRHEMLHPNRRISSHMMWFVFQNSPDFPDDKCSGLL